MKPSILLAFQGLLKILASFLNTALYAGAFYLASQIVKKAKLENCFSNPTPLVKLALILVLAPFIFTPLNFVFNRLVAIITTPGPGLLNLIRTLEGIFLVVVLWFIYKNFKGGEKK